VGIAKNERQASKSDAMDGQHTGRARPIQVKSACVELKRIPSPQSHVWAEDFGDTYAAARGFHPAKHFQLPQRRVE
jgi:hypothetical protein